MCISENNKVSFFKTKILPLFLRGTLPFEYVHYITPTLAFYLEIAKLGYLQKLNSKEVNEVLSNNTCYYKEVFDMYNYIMLIMGAIDEDRQKEYQKQQAAKPRDQIKKEQNMTSFQRLMGNDPIFDKEKSEDEKPIIIEVTPEDMKRAKKEKEERQKQIRERRLQIGVNKKKGNRLPSGGKTTTRSSGK